MSNNTIRLHRGPKTKMTSGTGKNLVLQRGELFVEYPDAGIGSASSKLKVGDGVSAYSSLPYITDDSEPVETVKICMCKVRYLINATNWSNSVDSNGYYTYTLTLTTDIDPRYSPSIDVTGENDTTFATSTAKEAFSLLGDLSLIDVDSLILYAKTKPEVDFYIFVEGKEFDYSIFDLYFDPETHTATEEDFIRFLDLGLYTKRAIGYKTVLSSNTPAYEYRNGTWIISDVNHDYNNTGQYGCYDLINEYGFLKAFDANNHNWRDSDIRTWLNNTFYNGFSNEFKNRVMNIKYKSEDSWYNDDKIILLSFTEVNGDSSSIGSAEDFIIEGTPYPVFTNDDSRKRMRFIHYNYYFWFLRSRYIGQYYSDFYIYSVTGAGSFSVGTTDSYNLIIMALRIS